MKKLILFLITVSATHAFADRESPETLVFECDEASSSIVVGMRPDRVWLILPGRTVQLPRVQAASGVKYAVGDDVFWTKGQETMIDVAGTSYRDCRNNPEKAVWEHAKLNGVSFRAAGHEPEWKLEIFGQRQIAFGSQSGLAEFAAPVPHPRVNRVQKQTRFSLDDHRWFVDISGQQCQDAMSGTQYPATVTVTIEGQVFRGCGKALH